MPIFTLDSIRHPSPAVGWCYSIKVVFPDLTLAAHSLPALVSPMFQMSVISRSLADSLDFELLDSMWQGSLVLETQLEGEPSIHRTKPLEFHFSPAHPRMGNQYLHLAWDDLHRYFTSKEFASEQPGEASFLSLTPTESPELFCRVLPLERE